MINGAFARACTICPFGDASQLRPLDGLSPPLLPRHGDGDRPGSLGDIGLSENDLLLDDSSGSPGSGSRRRRLLVFWQNLANTLMHRRSGSLAPELLPEEKLSVSNDAYRSGAAAAAGSDSERDVVESKAIERRRRWTATRMESVRSRLRASGSDALDFAAGHRPVGRAFSASGMEETLFRRSTMDLCLRGRLSAALARVVQPPPLKP
jgi:hypothetical protein